MLVLHLNSEEYWDESKSEFTVLPDKEYHFNHCLKSIAKWESLTGKVFLSKYEKHNSDDIKLYIRCMCDSDISDKEIYALLWNYGADIKKYLETKQSATVVNLRTNTSANRDTLTSEVIYYYMAAAMIPFECDTWHISRLLALLEVAAAKSQPDKQMSRRAIYEQNALLNKARRAGRPG